MTALLAALRGSFLAEMVHLARSRLFVALTVIQAVTFLFLVSLFGLTGSRAPTAVVTDDRGTYAKDFIAQLAAAHHSFDLRSMDQVSATAALAKGDLVAIITLPNNFSYALAHGENTTVSVTVDNVNTDMTDDIQRALPSAIVAFGRQFHLSGIRVQVAEHDLVDHDTDFIPYLVVSGLVLDAFVIASVLSAMAVAREFEFGTVKLLAIAPVHPLFSLLGRVLATNMVAVGAMIFPVLLVILGYKVLPIHPLEMIGALLLCIVIFSCMGVALGALLRRTLPVVSLVFGLCLPLYLCSNALEPQRFDGNLVWILAHASPVYYAVSILEHAFHGLQVTPESIATCFTVLICWMVAMLLLASVLLRPATIEKTAIAAAQEKRGKDYHRFLWPLRSVTPAWMPLFLFLVLLCGTATWLMVLSSQRATAISRQQQAALQVTTEQQDQALLLTYTNDISDMLMHNDLLHAKPDDAVRILANARTQETLRQLDPTSKRTLILFLYDTKLLDDDYHIISLKGANLRAVPLAHLDINDIALDGADLSGADLSGINLSSATLVGTNLSAANLAGADLRGTDMHNTDVNNANLAGADLTGAVGTSTAQLEKTRSLAGAILPNGSVLPGQDNDTD